MPISTKLGNAYGFPVTDRALLEVLHLQLKQKLSSNLNLNLKTSKNQECLLTYSYGDRKSYIIVQKCKVYYVINDQIYHVQSSLPKVKDFLIEGHIAGTTFLLYDIHFPGTNYTFAARLKKLNELVDADAYEYDPILDPYKLCVTDYVTSAYWQSFIYDYKPSYKEKMTGWLMITGYNTVNPDYQVLPLHTTFKFNEIKNARLSIVLDPPCDSAYFQVSRTELPDIYKLFLRSETGALVYYDIACVPDKLTSAYLTRNQGAFEVYQCCYHKLFKKWQPIAKAEPGHPVDSIDLITPVNHGRNR